MGGSKSSQTQQQISDSFNSSLDQVLNLTDAGNVKINIGDAAVRAGTGSQDWVPIAALTVVGIVGLAWALSSD